jgi:tetratricopeptide (TPR) repeat protein
VVALADEIDDTLLRYWASVFQGLLALDVGDFETAARGRQVQEAIAAETGQPMFLWVNTFAPALLATMAGEFSRAEELTDESAAIGSEAGQPDVFAVYAAQIHVIRYEQGRLEEILEIQEKAVEEAPLLEAYSSALALSYCELGDLEKARAALRGVAANGFDITPTPSSKAALGFLAEVAARVDDREAASALYERLMPWRDQFSYTGVTMFGPLERYLGLTATCLGRHEDAAEHFRRSVEVCERIEAPTWLARSRHEWALMLLGRNGPGDREAAEPLLRQALESAEKYGCSAFERRVRAAIEDPERARA